MTHKQEYLASKEQLSQARDALKQRTQEVAKDLDRLRSKLEENDTHIQLTAMEQRLSFMESNNFQLKERTFLKGRSCHRFTLSTEIRHRAQENDFSIMSREVKRITAEYNAILEKNLSSPLKRI